MAVPHGRSTWSLGPMLTRLSRIVICALVALIVGAAASAAVHAAGSPGIWSHPEWLWLTAQTGVFFYVAAPLAVLILVSLWRRTPSATLLVLVGIGWLTAIFAWWAYWPWIQSGEFPWWGFQRHYLGMLPVPLAFGLAFAICARRLLGPNYRLERP